MRSNGKLYVQVTMHRDNLSINNQQDASSIQNFLFCQETLHVSSICCAHHQELPAVHVALFQPDSPRQRPQNLHEMYQLPRVQLITPDDGHSRCLKHVEFHDKIKNSGYLIYLIGYLYEDNGRLFCRVYWALNSSAKNLKLERGQKW
jgi:hypothetical protein